MIKYHDERMQSIETVGIAVYIVARRLLCEDVARHLLALWHHHHRRDRPLVEQLRLIALSLRGAISGTQMTVGAPYNVRLRFTCGSGCCVITIFHVSSGKEWWDSGGSPCEQTTAAVYALTERLRESGFTLPQRHGQWFTVCSSSSSSSSRTHTSLVPVFST